MAALFAVLAASIIAAIKVSSNPLNDVVPAAERKMDAASRQNHAGRGAWFPGGDKQDGARVEPLLPRNVSADIPPLFGQPARKNSADFAVAVAPPIPPPPQARRAPPLPFTFLGKMFEKGQMTLFLSFKGKSIIAKKGDTIDGIYRVTAIKQDSVEFVYLPLREKQILPIGSIGDRS
jgi:hypothetical protein